MAKTSQFICAPVHHHEGDSNYGDSRFGERLPVGDRLNERFFAATILGGRLHVSGILDWGLWDSSRLDWGRENELDPIFGKGEYGAKVRTLEELEAALRAPAGVAPARRVWIHESLEGDARRLWEELSSAQ